jgi:hypothetical protein
MTKNSTIKRDALIQMSMDPDSQLNLDKAAERVYEAARQGIAKRFWIRRRYHLHELDCGLPLSAISTSLPVIMDSPQENSAPATQPSWK